MQLDVRVGAALRLKRETDERKARERELRAEKEFTAAILEHSCDGIAVTAPDGEIVFASPGAKRRFAPSGVSWTRRLPGARQRVNYPCRAVRAGAACSVAPMPMQSSSSTQRHGLGRSI